MLIEKEIADLINDNTLDVKVVKSIYRSGYHKAINDVIIEMCADCKKSPCWDAMPEGCYQYDKLKEMRDKA